MAKKLLSGLVIVGALTIGDYVKPISSVYDSIRFHNVPIAKSSPNDPWNYSLEEVVVDNERQMYLVNDKKELYLRVNDDGCTCGLENKLYDWKEGIQNGWENLKENVSGWWDRTF